MTSGVPVQGIDLGVVSDQGRVRPRNEDAVSHDRLVDMQGNLVGWIFVVADGVGGEFHGDLASQMAVHRVIDVYKTFSLQNPLIPPSELLRDAIQFANGEIYNKAVEMNVAGHMGTTLVAAVLRLDGVLHVGWVGDSRLYVISRRMDRILQVSQDHTEVADQVRQKLITADQALTHPRRNVLSRSVGGMPETTPEFAEGLLELTDTIVICSDGLTRHLTPDHIKTLALQPVPSEQIAHQMVGTANQMGGKDNITAVVVYIGQRDSYMDTDLPPPAVSESQRLIPVSPVSQDSGSYRPIAVAPSSPTMLAVKKPPSRRPLLRLALVAILVLVVVAVGLVFAARQRPVVVLMPTEAAAVTIVSPTAAEAISEVVEATLPLTITATTVIPDSTQTAQALIVGIAQIQTTVTLALTKATGQPLVMLTETKAATASSIPAVPTKVDLSVEPTKPRPPQQAELTLTAQNVPIVKTMNAMVALSETASPSATPDESSNIIVATDTPTLPLEAPTTRVLFAPLTEPYPNGSCLVTLRESPVYPSVGGLATSTLPKDTVVFIGHQAQGFYEAPGGRDLYYSVKPNDGRIGVGWVKSDSLVPAQDLSPEEQAAVFSPLVTNSDFQPETAAWTLNQSVIIKSNFLGCLPMLLRPDDPDRIYIVEAMTSAVVIDDLNVLVNDNLWWHVRLADGRDGWVQQIYLTKAPS